MTNDECLKNDEIRNPKFEDTGRSGPRAARIVSDFVILVSLGIRHLDFVIF